MSWISLQEFADAHGTDVGGRPRWAHGEAAPSAVLDQESLRAPLEDGLNTMMALQRAEWLEAGVVLGDKAWPSAHEALVSACTTLGVSAPTAIVGPCALKNQHTLGTDGRPVMRVSSWFLRGASPTEQLFLFGRLAGHIRCGQVTWSTVHEVLSEGTGLRGVARSVAGPLADLVLTPVSIATRLSLLRWHRAAELNADRAGLIAAGSLEEACRALLREALGVNADVDVDAYLATTTQQERRTVGRFAELWSDRPWLHHRLQALQLFVTSDAWVEASGQMAMNPISDAELAEKTDALLAVT